MNEYLLERRLKEKAPNLHLLMGNNVTILNRMLKSFLSWFPDFTDHSALHSLNVLDYCNRLMGGQVDRLSPAECYVLIMACYLHDTGLCISRKDFEIFSRELGLEDYRKTHKDKSEADVIREFHHEFSGAFIRKYANLFELNSKEMLFAIVQVSRGHRKTDLLDEKEYPDLETAAGVIRTAALAAIIRLADEIDMGSDRNPKFLYNTSKLTKQKDIDSFAVHDSIKMVEVRSDRIVLCVKPTEERIVPLIEKLRGKIQSVLDYCVKVVAARSDLRITQKSVVVEEWN